MKPVFPLLLLIGVLLAAAGCYGGNALIGASHGALFLAAAASFFEKREGSGARYGTFGLPVSAWALLFFAGICIISVVANWEAYDKPVKDLKKLRHLALPLCLLCLPAFRDRLVSQGSFYGKWAFATLLGVATLVTVADMINLATGFHPLIPGGMPRILRLGGIFGMVMTYGYSMQFTVFVVAGFLILCWEKRIEAPRWLLALALAAFVICSVGTVLSGSRGALLGCVIGSVVLIFVLQSKWLIYPFFGIVIVAVMTSLMMPYKLEAVRPNESARLAQWKTALVTGLRHPLAGIGYRQFEKQSRDLKEQYGFPHDVFLTDEEGVPYSYHLKGHAHNNYFEALASTGVFGMLSLAFFFGAWLCETWGCAHTRLLFAPAIAGFIVAGFFENSFFDGEITSALMLYYVASQVMMNGKGVLRLQDLKTHAGLLVARDSAHPIIGSQDGRPAHGP